VLEALEWLMPQQLNRRAGELLAAHLADLGIAVRTPTRVKELVGDERVAGVELEDGTHLDADCVVTATGVQPNSYLARRAGLAVNRGVVVDDRLRASHPDVFAAGDVAEHRGVLYGSWAAAQHEGRIAGISAAGAATDFGGLARSHALKVVGVNVLSIGRFEPGDAGFAVVEDEADGRYARFVFHDGRLVGAVLFGDTSAARPVTKAIEQGMDCANLLAKRPTTAEVIEELRSRA